MSRFANELKKIQDSLADAAKIGGQEIKRGVGEAKKQLTRMQFIQKRKDLYQELGRTLFEAYKDGLPEELQTYFSQTDFKEIFDEIDGLDAELERRLKGS